MRSEVKQAKRPKMRASQMTREKNNFEEMRNNIEERQYTV
jgi:hypothetical protein